MNTKVLTVFGFCVGITCLLLFIIMHSTDLIILKLLKANSSEYSVNDSRPTLDFNISQLAQDDPRLVEFVRKLIIPPPPLKEPYNFDKKELANKTMNLNPSVGQTQAVLDILTGFTANPFYIECGANDGELFSNTLYLERTLGWQGILIEAEPVSFERLVRKKRKASIAHLCLSNVPHHTVLHLWVDDKHANLGSSLGKVQGRAGMKGAIIVSVQCFPLYTVLLALKRTTIDFFSLDIEGSEMDVLNTLPFDKVIFKVITIEHHAFEGGKGRVRKYMEERNYTFYQTFVLANQYAGDSIFIHKSVQLTPQQSSRIGFEDEPKKN